MGKNRGRPLEYNEEIADEICDVISRSPVGLPELCKQNPHWPSYNAINEWRNKLPHFGDKYTRAKQIQVDCLVDEILTSTYDSSNDYFEDIDGKKVSNSSYLTRLRYRIDSIKWLAGKLAPKIYGDKNYTEADVNLHAKSLQDLA